MQRKTTSRRADVIRDYRKHMFHRLPRRGASNDDGGIDFYIEIQDGKHSLRWSNTQYERPPPCRRCSTS